MLSCPACGAPGLAWVAGPPSSDMDCGPTVAAELRCGCGCAYPVRHGIPDMHLPQGREPGPAFSAERLKKITDIEQRHFWFVGRRAWLQALLSRHLGGARTVLDLGCGSGFTARRLSQGGLGVVAVDSRPEGLRSLAGSRSGATAVQADATRLPFAEASFDAVVMLDVMEHTDDSRLLREVRRVLRPGGVLFLTVPAMPWLWSQRDEAAGHRRRYTRTGLKRLLDDEGWELREIGWYQFLLFPLVMATRLAGRRRRQPVQLEEKIFPLINSLFARINLFEARMGTTVRWPWGSSLAAVCRKSDA